MKTSKVVKFKTPFNEFGIQRLLRYVIRLGLYLLRILFPLLPFIAIGLVFSLSKTPHLRVSYTYKGSYEHKRFISCNYWGMNGVQKVFQNPCPLIQFMEKKPQFSTSP